MGALYQIGISLFIDFNSILIVFVGAFGSSLIKNNKENYIINFGKGAIFFGWLGMLIGLIALTGGKYDNWGDIDKMGAALKVLMLPIFYGYMIKLTTMPFNNQK